MSDECRPSDEPGSVTRWLSGLRAGQSDAVRALWERYCGPCRDLVRKRLGGAARLVDEDDVFAEAFLNFCKAAREGAFPDLASRENVIRLLARITLRKACDARRREERRRAKVRGESALGEAGFEPFASREPPAEFDAEVRRMLELLPTDELREIALMRMAGYGREEIAAELKMSVATLDRRLSHIRAKWASLRDGPQPEGERT